MWMRGKLSFSSEEVVEILPRELRFKEEIESRLNKEFPTIIIMYPSSRLS